MELARIFALLYLVLNLLLCGNDAYAVTLCALLPFFDDGQLVLTLAQAVSDVNAGTSEIIDSGRSHVIGDGTCLLHFITLFVWRNYPNLHRTAALPSDEGTVCP